MQSIDLSQNQTVASRSTVALKMMIMVKAGVGRTDE